MKKRTKKTLKTVVKARAKVPAKQAVAVALAVDRHETARLVHQEILDKMKQHGREIHEKTQQIIRDQQEACHHLQGGSPLSDMAGELTSIVWHTTLDKVTHGICTVCLRHFVPTDPDYWAWRNKKSGNKPSSSTYVPEWPKAKPANPFLRRSYAPPEKTLSELSAPLARADGFQTPIELDKLPDEDIKNLFDGVRKLGKAEVRNILTKANTMLEIPPAPPTLWQRIRKGIRYWFQI